MWPEWPCRQAWTKGRRRLWTCYKYLKTTFIKETAWTEEKRQRRLTLGSDFHLPILEGRVPLRKLLFKPLPPWPCCRNVCPMWMMEGLVPEDITNTIYNHKRNWMKTTVWMMKIWKIKRAWRRNWFWS